MTSILNRRDFLKLSLAVTGGLAASRWLPHGPWGAAWLKGSFVPLSQAQGACPTLVQSPWLGMVALGDNTMDDPDKGNHLRWAFEPSLDSPRGFPDGGFDLYRRPHYEAAPVCVNFQGFTINQNLGRRVTIGDLILESMADIRTVELVAANVGPEIDLRNHLPITIWPREVCHRIQVSVVDFSSSGGTIRAVAYGGDVIVDVATSVSSSNIQILDLAADHIDRVMLVPGGDLMNGVLTQVCAVTVASDACPPSPGWTHLNNALICLPLFDEDYPSHVPAPADEWPTATARIPITMYPHPTQDEFTDLRNMLAGIYNPPPSLMAINASCPPAPDNDEGRPTLEPDPLGIVLLTTLAPYIARMVGLYWIDGGFYVGQGLQGPAAATVGTAYDYLIVAHYPATAENAEACDNWELDGVGTIINGTVHHGPLTYVTSLALSVDAHLIDNPPPLDDYNNALSIPDNLGNPLRITLPEPVQAVELRVDVPDAAARAFARAYSNGVEVDTHMRSASVNGPTTLLLVAEAIDAVELEGRNLYLAEVCYYTDYLPGGDMGYIVYNVTLGAPPALPEPSYLNGEALPVLTGQDRNCNPVTGQMAAGLHWDRDVSDDAVAPGGAVLFDLERQPLGDGDTPNAINPGNWTLARENILVAPSSPDADCAPYQPLPGWPAERPDYIDAPPGPQDRWYAYRVRGRDIFGRSSAYRESSALELLDTIPPPPPADVHAKYLDPADPYLAPDEHAWTHPQGLPRHGLRVGWRWTDNLQQQAPDVSQFRIYLKTGRLNVLVGNIAKVDEPDAEGNILLTTDTLAAGLPAGDVPDAFKGEWLAQGVNLYHVVASGSSQDEWLTLTVKRIEWDAPQLPDRHIRPAELQPMPKPGAFSLSFHPPKPLAGMITGVGETIDTNVLYTGVAHDLAANKLLRQAGRLWTITDNAIDAESGKLQLTVHARACEPTMPNSGVSFLVVDADGMTPHLLDEGSPHWRDYRDPVHSIPFNPVQLNWEQRLPPEPRTAEPRGLITAVTDSGNGTSTVTTDQHLTDDTGHYLGGELTVGNFTWPVIGHTTGDKFTLTVVNNRRGRGTGKVKQVPPNVGDDFIYWPDIVIAIELSVPSDQPATYAAVGVSAADNKAYIDDIWPGDNGGQSGNESRVSPPVIIARMNRSVPPPPGISNQGVNVLMATQADFLGHSRFTVRWEKGASDLRYRVYRALANTNGSEPALERYRLLTPEPLRAQDCPDLVEEGHPIDDSLLAYQDTLDGKSTSHYYYRVRAVNAAGRLGDWSEAIGPVACPDITPPATPSLHSILGGEDRIILTWAANSEADMDVYRVYCVEEASLADDLRRMGQPIAVLPGRVLIVKGNVALKANEDDLPTGMNIQSVQGVYQQANFNPNADPITDQDATNHLDRWDGDTIHTSGLADGTPVVVVYTDQRGGVNYTCDGGARMVYVDGGRIPRRPYTYRLAAVDANQNASAPTPPRTGQAYHTALPPEPDTFTGEWTLCDDRRQVLLAWGWNPPALHYQCAVQRRRAGSSVFMSVSGNGSEVWLPAGVYVWQDDPPDDTSDWEYRLRIRDQAGNVATSSHIITENARR